MPSSLHRQRQLRFVVRAATADPLQLVAPIRRVAATLEPDQPIFDALSLEQALYNDGASAYTLALLLAAIGVIAQSVAAVGIYGLVSHRTTRRTREIGVRLALGASRGTVTRLVILQATLPVACGGFIGLIAATALAFATAGAVSSNARDPVAYATVIAAVSLTALVATYMPARRASRIDPVNALRAE